jgi:uncharacterized integral membrane protein
MRLFGKGGSDAADDYQPRLWATIIGLVLIVLWVIAFISKNDHAVKINFVLFSTEASLIWLCILLLAVGFISGVLASQMYRRRRSGRTAEQQSSADG